MLLLKLHFKWERWKYNKEFDVYVSTLGNVNNLLILQLIVLDILLLELKIDIKQYIALLC